MSQFPPKLPEGSQQAPPPPYVYSQQQQPYQVPPPGNGLAIAALVCGLVSIVFFPAGLVAIILGIVAIAKAPKPMVRGKGMAIAGIVLGTLSLLILPAILLPALSHAREQANRIKCASNLRQITLAVTMYTSADQHSAFPPDVATLAKVMELDPKMFVCPTSNQNAATAPEQIRVGSPNCSYIYVYPKAFKGNQVPSDFVIVYEPIEDHSKGANFGFADGRVEWLAVERAKKLIADIEAGKNPSVSLSGPPTP